ncbi:tyrosine-protein phosphatase [uncultured Sphingomonas sp.]|uniref:tyrosine-protein phosphatase n=1 Tax=uncultured Sphingomonas sp. TaxID=158754 RepID=UPI0026192599|nr:tyrosine-protein phosphatase [uncultured Sphingomonas sp.]
MTDRVLSFEGIHNFRDYGGYDTPAGRIRTGLLWRSGQHGDATPGDLASVAALGIATVVDLRGDMERRISPCLRHPGFDGVVIFAPGETTGSELAPHEEAGAGITTADEARAGMKRLYATMPYRDVLIRSLRLYFEALETRGAASLLHCLAGKDRTGLAVALFHHLLGVNDDEVMADYLLTNTAGDPARRIASAAGSVRERYGPRMSDEAVIALMSVEADYLRTAFAAIRERHGDIARYAEQVLGVDAARREAIAARMIG